MADAGVSWTVRKLAKSWNYGVGVVSLKVEQEGSSLVLKFHNGPGQGENVMRLEVGGGQQSTINEDGSNITVTPRWEDQALIVTGRAEGGSALQPTKRWISWEELVCESRTSTGVVVRRYFERV
jgi:hypothetical protein